MNPARPFGKETFSYKTFTVLLVRGLDVALRVPTLRLSVLVAEVGLASFVEAIVGRQKAFGAVRVAAL